MDLTGKIIAVLPANSGVSSRTGNPWMSQEFVIEVPGKQFNIQMGEDITISFDIDAHEYNGRWFNEIRAYNVTRGQAPVAAAPGVAPAQAAPFPPQDANAPFPPAQEPAGEGSTDDLPF